MNSFEEWRSSKNTRKCARDLRFLEKLRTATRQELEQILKNHSHKNSPVWKWVAITRALQRNRR